MRIGNHQFTSINETMYIRVSFRGAGEHSPLLGFGLPPLGNFGLKVNQFKCFEILVVALCIINVKFGYINGTLYTMVNAGITKIVKTTISACDIVFYHLVCYQED